MKSVKDQPSYQIMICLIKIWTPKDPKKPMEVPSDAMLISEVEEIEIDESYKKLIGTASVKFPRGTVIRKTITTFNAEEAAKNTKLDVNISDAGIIEEVRNSSTVASTSSFSIGQRIRIYLGYTTDPKIANLAKVNNSTRKSIFNDNQYLQQYEKAYPSNSRSSGSSSNSVEKYTDIAFDGYITKVSVDTPIELQCENLGYALKEITCPKITIKSKATILDFLGDNAKYNLLKGTGLKLHSQAKSQKWDLGQIKLHPELTVADVLTEWSKYGIHCFITEENGEPVVSIGRSYFDNAKSDSIINADSKKSEVPQILFNYHVAQNGLSLTSTEKKFLAVEAEGLGADDKFFHLTLLQNPKYDSSQSGSDKWRVVNVSNLSKKAMKRGAKVLDKAKDKVSMDLYTKIPYHSRKIPITKDELIEEAKKYYESYNMNGIEGSLTLFGDLHLHTATKVELVDDRYPGKNGYYLVDEVHTTFGTSGYRQTIKLPYCIKRNKQENSNNGKK